MKTGHDFQRFLKAQDLTYARVAQELKAGRKQGHWMWFIFPQAAGLGRSAASRRYAIQSKAEALAYLNHPILGDRLRQCACILLELKGKSAHAIFSSPDDLKLRSCMTLFAEISEPGSVFTKVLDHYYDGNRCLFTLDFLKKD
jgi:uncharacterized protein (DUF1810 family)